jgi:hypothetical protein
MFLMYHTCTPPHVSVKKKDILGIPTVVNSWDIRQELKALYIKNISKCTLLIIFKFELYDIVNNFLTEQDKNQDIKYDIFK